MTGEDLMSNNQEAKVRRMHYVILNTHSMGLNPFNASCFKLLLFKGFSAILV